MKTQFSKKVTEKYYKSMLAEHRKSQEKIAEKSSHVESDKTWISTLRESFLGK